MIFDVNTWLGRWPFQQLDADTPARLKKKLVKAGIGACCVSQADAVLVSDPDIWNQRLFAAVAKDPFFVPVPVFNPCLYPWERILAGYQKQGIKAVRFLPGYHSYGFSDTRCVHAVARVRKLGMLPLIQIRLEDERTHHLLMQVKPPAIEEAVVLANKITGPIVFLCGYLNEVNQLGEKTQNACSDFSFCEKLNTLAVMAHSIPWQRILFGSHAPFFYPEAAMLKFSHAELGKKELAAIAGKNLSKMLEISLS